MIIHKFLVSFSRTADFGMEYTTETPQSNGSISDLYSRQLKDIDPMIIEEAKYYNDNIGIWGAFMNYNNLMIDATKKAPWTYSINPNGLDINDYLIQTQSVYRKGISNNYSIGSGFNINDMVYLGATFGIRTFDLDEYVTYYENGVDGNIGDFQELENTSNLYQNGVSFDFKIGATIQPIDGLRIGLAYHAPRSTSIEEKYSLYQNISFKNNDYYSQNAPYVTNSYNIVSSHRLLTGISYRFSSLGIISFDYTLNMNGTIKMKNTNGTENINNYLRNSLRNNSEYKIGIEIQPFKGFFVRGGYNYIETPYSDEYLEYLVDYGVKNNKDRRQYGAQHYASAGLGYRFMNFYIDFAYQYVFNKVPSYMLYGESFDDITITAENQISESITRNMFSLTCGVKF
ncbi:MAG: outer membrane protein transport protein [Bacteroidetes bacterium]|nr:outer membrane protein transport protein [Bacteroidota bacterium]